MTLEGPKEALGTVDAVRAVGGRFEERRHHGRGSARLCLGGGGLFVLKDVGQGPAAAAVVAAAVVAHPDEFAGGREEDGILQKNSTLSH